MALVEPFDRAETAELCRGTVARHAHEPGDLAGLSRRRTRCGTCVEAGLPNRSEAAL